MSWDKPHPTVIMVAPNGARRGRADHLALPLGPAELGQTAARCREAGAAAIHVHVRDRAGGHVLDAGLYREALDAIHREAGADMLAQVTTEAVGRYQPAEQMAVMDALAPDFFSVALRELIVDEAGVATAAAFLERHSRRGAMIQYILYDQGDWARFVALSARGVLPEDGRSVLLVLGRYSADQRSHPRDLLDFLAAGPPDRGPAACPWMVCAFGEREAQAATTAALLGGHARVGFENNLWMPDGRVADDNGALVAIVAAALTGLGQPLASPVQARAALGGRA